LSYSRIVEGGRAFSEAVLTKINLEVVKRRLPGAHSKLKKQ
jgi:hypothetical protein